MIIIFLAAIFFYSIQSQSIQVINNIKFDPDKGQIQKHDLYSDSNSTGLVLFIKNGVKPHYHQFHTEAVYVLDGEANFFLKSDWKLIKKGDVIHIPKQIIHAVEVTSEIPLKVISIQTPKFTGKDRIFTEIKKEK